MFINKDSHSKQIMSPLFPTDNLQSQTKHAPAMTLYNTFCITTSCVWLLPCYAHFPGQLQQALNNFMDNLVQTCLQKQFRLKPKMYE